ncbi:uncharacterized protein [Procambarus clarkii]|uniref:uncharacterized protein n=1 Tax=Procambarus clarkii TaxID=6728 RepID=UPI001E672055|nr:uncharacterized protein LOC123753889 [Procambarus clarkii]
MAERPPAPHEATPGIITAFCRRKFLPARGTTARNDRILLTTRNIPKLLGITWNNRKMVRIDKRAVRVWWVVMVAVVVLVAAEMTETWFEYRARTKRELKNKARTSLDTNMELDELHSRQKRTISFPTGSTFTITPVLCIPVVNVGDLVGYLDVELPFTIKLPNATQVSFAGRMDDDRLGIYAVVINTLSRFGVDGKSCLLRAVCEVAESPLRDDGLLGEILNIILTASYGSTSSELYDYVNAEYYGRAYGDCWSAYPQCPMSLFKLFDDDDL